jgi:pimeloyl-ACP methyl ester carboxylesterase
MDGYAEENTLVETLTLTRPGGSIAYDDSGGDGEPVVMLPGMGSLRAEYRYLAPEVAAAGYRAVTADLRGQGESSVNWPEYTLAATGQDILALIDHLHAGPAHVVSTSFSPGAAVWAAAERPDAIRSLILISPFLRDAPPGFVKGLLQSAVLHGPWKVAAWGMFYKSLYPTRKPDDFDAYLADLKANLREPGRFDAVVGMAYAPKTDAEERLDLVKAPVLVVMGTKDPDWADPKAEAQFIAQALSAELAMIEGAGHYPYTEMPEKVTPIILEFLQRFA